MMDRGARPAADCIFTDPRESKVLKLTNVAAYGEGKKGGGVAVFNFSSQRRRVVFSPSDVWDISHYDQYWVYDYFNQTARICGKDERIEEEIGGDGFAWYEILGAEVRGPSVGVKRKICRIYGGGGRIQVKRQNDGSHERAGKDRHSLGQRAGGCVLQWDRCFGMC